LPAFCIDSSQSLTNQYLIRDHLMFHYNKILSAKVADQQRREKLKKKIARCEKEMSEGKTGSRSSSRDSGRGLSSSVGKSSLEAEDTDLLFPSAPRAHPWPRALLPPDKQHLVHSSPLKYSGKYSGNTSNTSDSSVGTSSPRRKTSGLSCSCSTDSFVGLSHSRQHQETKCKVYSRDLLDRHSDFFTDSRKPFTPRTLISDAKSFLSQYRYYSPARRRRKGRYKQQVDAETQTDVIRYRGSIFVLQLWNLSCTDSTSLMKSPAICVSICNKFNTLYTLFFSPCREEELLYLTFIEDVTKEILKFGLFSNRVLEELFEYHIQENKHHLDEVGAALVIVSLSTWDFSDTFFFFFGKGNLLVCLWVRTAGMFGREHLGK
uniref:Spermatogenesis associated 7 n=1 Tax=Nothoprocta perdicaria TaxID=30464 RepID=A0A8C6Z0B4_NOTPE